MTSSRKKAIFRKLSRDWLAGYVPADGFERQGQVEMLGLDGKVVHLAIADLKWIGYVRDFNSGDVSNPEKLVRKTFAGRPRGEGLVVRVHLKDGDMVEGLATNDVTLVQGEGIFLTPPDLRSNTQRLWIPRTGIDEFEIVSVLSTAKKKPPTAVTAESLAQENLFGE
jgi:hypothetical protein